MGVSVARVSQRLLVPNHSYGRYIRTYYSTMMHRWEREVGTPVLFAHLTSSKQVSSRNITVAPLFPF